MQNWKKVVVSGSDAVLNSVTASFKGSLTGTASYATQALSASYAYVSQYTNATLADITANGANTPDDVQVNTLGVYDSANDFYTILRGGDNLLEVASGDSSLLFRAEKEQITIVKGGVAAPTSSIISNALITAGRTYNLPNASGTFLLTNQTASWATNAVTASYATQALSSSYALTASFALNGGGGAAFPYVGAAKITGSLVVSGSGGVNASLDTISSELKDSTGVVSIGWSNRFLYDSTGTATTVDYNQGVLYDLSGVDSIQWINRGALDSGGNASIDWNGRILYEPGGLEALNYSTSASVSSQLYYNNVIPAQVQRELANNPTYAGQVIQASLDVAVALYNLVYLDTDGTWYPLKNLPTVSTKMVGICVDTGGYVLIEGDIGVSDDNTKGAYVIGADYGLPIYIGGTNGVMTTTVPTSGVVRILGHVYYNSSTDVNWWTMKFRPSTDWYEI